MDIADMSADRLQSEFELNGEDFARVRRLGEHVVPKLEPYVQEFYDWMEGKAFYQRFFFNAETVEHVKAAQVAYWHDFFAGQFDDDYVQHRVQVGTVHARIELPLEIYLTANNFFFERVLKYVDELDEEKTETIAALTKRFNLDAAVVASAYERITREALIEQSQAIIEMSTPVTTLWNGILLLPIVGIVDSKRALDISSTTLESISKHQARCLILDISGVAVVDTAVANNLIKVTKATRLMGCESVISGLSPEIAQMIVELGIDVGDVKTTATMRDALSYGFSIVGYEVTSSDTND